MPKTNDAFREEVVRLKEQLELMKAARPTPSDADEWLRTLYSSFSDRMKSDNERIWSIGAIFVPLSLSAFAALVGLEAPGYWKTLTLGLASVLLLVLWLFIAENQRAFQQKSEAWLVAISETIGIAKVGKPKVQGNALNRLLTFGNAIQFVRWALVALVFVGWLGLFLLQQHGCILQPEKQTSCCK